MYSFDEIKGNEKIVDILKASAYNKKISHAYLLDAATGTGKMLMAKAFTKAILCKEGTACGHCTSCISFDSNNNPDVIYVNSDKKSIGVTEIREQVSRSIEIKPFLYRYKVFIIEDAHTMTQQAQNALLKTLEDPKPYGVFLLLSDNLAAFLPTILSRCITFRLKPISLQRIKDYLTENNLCDASSAHIYSIYAQGSIGKAVKLAKSEEFMAMRDEVLSLMLKLSDFNLIEVYRSISLFEKYKEDIQTVLDIIILLFRDAIVYKCIMDDSKIIAGDRLNEIKVLTLKTPLRLLINYYEAVFNAKIQLTQNSNFQMTMEVLLLKLKEK